MARTLTRRPVATSRRGLAASLIGLVVCWSCGFGGGNFTVDTKSPNGRYRVSLLGTVEPRHPLPLQSFKQTVKLQAFSESQLVIQDDKFLQEDSYDELFLQRYPTHEWINDSVLRFGHSSSRESFSDQIVVINKLMEPVDCVTLNYGKRELFLVFELAPGASLELRGSPQFDTYAPASMVYFQARTLSGLHTGNVGTLARREESAGPIKLVIEITEK